MITKKYYYLLSFILYDDDDDDDDDLNFVTRIYTVGYYYPQKGI